MGDIGIPELLIILAIVIVVFGPARIAGLGRSLGQAIRAFRHATEGKGDGRSTDLADKERI
jgi:sec-independent protein translocase protein TatA